MTQRAERAAEAVQGTMDRLLNTPVFTLSRTPVTVLTLVTFAVVVIATLWLSRAAHRGTERAFRLRGVADPGTTGVAARLASYAVLLLGLGVALQTIGVDLATLFAAGAFFAVALGFAMQNVAQNFIAGVLLLTERSIKPGDVLEVEGRVVRVTRMGMRATVARTRDEEDLIIPNSTLIQNTVTNYTLRDTTYRLRATVGVAYESDLNEVLRVLRTAAAGFPERLATPEPRVQLTGFGESSVDFEVLVWVEDPWRARWLRSELNQAIWWALKDAGIGIPFPQRTLHVVSMPASGAPAADRAPAAQDA